MNRMRILAFVFFSGMIILTGCKKDDDNPGEGKTSTTIKVTDAPIDDADVTGAFVTIADIQLDGQNVQGFSKTTVDLHAYQNGATKSIGTFNLDSRTYNTITFVLDYDADASGNAPGCYVLTTGGAKHKLESSSNAVNVSKNISLQSNTSSSLVADFDLRKMIIHQAGGASDQYDFATAAELQSSIRVIAESNAGKISGKLTDNISGSGKVIAYAYKKGTYNRDNEMEAQGASGVYFKNAVTSSLVDNAGNYQLHFLENGDYEVHFASYKDVDSDDEFELIGTLIVTGAGNIDLLDLTVGANATLTLNASVTGVLP